MAEMAQVDRNWDAIWPTYGIVALDHQWAAEKNLHPSENLDSDPSKGVYVLEAYHILHCLVPFPPALVLQGPNVDKYLGCHPQVHASTRSSTTAKRRLRS